MANNTELVFILDKSGSMGGLEDDTIGGYNSFLKKQQERPEGTRITTVLFDDSYELLHDRLDLRAIKPITEKDYYVGGSTALLDAIGKTIFKIEKVQKQSSKKYKPEKVLFVITTDGMENASREYSYDSIKSLVEGKKKEGWEFIFLGANIDAICVAESIGISNLRSANFHADPRGIRNFFGSLACKVHDFRCSEGNLEDDWADEINKDFNEREKDKI